MFANFHSTGSTPCCKEDFGAVSCESSFKKYAGILSRPVALWGFRLCKRLATPFTEIDIWGISGKGESFILGSDDKSS